MSIEGRIKKIEAAVGEREDGSPFLATLHSLDKSPVRFTRDSFLKYCRDTMPGFAHPIRSLFAGFFFEAIDEFRKEHPNEPTPYSPAFMDRFYVVLADNLVEVDKAIVAGEIPWLPDAIKEWEAKPRDGLNDRHLLP